jgi:hypothetical protein
MLKLSSGLGLVLLVVFGALVLLKFLQPANKYVGKWKGASARLPCMADGVCPSGQRCSGGFCSEGFMSPINISTDMSSCSAKECNGINAPCSRRETPCQEGTFCQGNQCVPIAAPDQGQAYNQIGGIL